MLKVKLAAIVTMIFLLPNIARAYFTTFDTADTLRAGENQLGLEPQYIFDNEPGGNVNLHYEMGVNDSSSVKFELGTGSVMFQGGAFYKIIPIPDYQNQPGIGAFGGIVLADINGVSVLSLRLHPIISKALQTPQAGQFTPYLAIPFGITLAAGTNTWPVQIEGGVKWLPPSIKHMDFWGEVGVELNSAFSYISVGMSVPFDDWGNIHFD